MGANGEIEIYAPIYLNSIYSYLQKDTHFLRKRIRDPCENQNNSWIDSGNH